MVAEECVLSVFRGRRQILTTALDRHLPAAIITTAAMRRCRWSCCLSVEVTMRNLRSQFALRYASAPARRSAFSLVELVVAVGILALMMTLAGQVFSLTSKSTSQASALTELSQSLRAFEQTLREDLRYAQRGNSIVVIQANPINAYWTRDGKDADDDGDPLNGYPHDADPEREGLIGDGILDPPRADVLMFFTARKSSSSIYPGVVSQVQQVVYGHAELGEYIPGGGGAGDPKYDFVSSTPSGEEAFPAWPDPTRAPAEQWHLARRSLLLMPTPPPAAGASDMYWAVFLYDDGDDGNEPQFNVFENATDVVESFIYEDRVLRPDPDAAPALSIPPVLYEIPNINDPAQPSPFSRSRLDSTPPALYANRLGHYFLPGCVSFKVEWALDPHSEFVGGRLDGEPQLYWIDQGDLGADVNDPSDDDPLAELQDAWSEATGTRKERLWDLMNAMLAGEDYTPLGGPDRSYSLSMAFRSYSGGQGGHEAYQLSDQEARLVAFCAERVGWPYSDDPELTDIFPAALRITVDVLDRGGRLDRPLRHVMIIPVGQ